MRWTRSTQALCSRCSEPDAEVARHRRAEPRGVRPSGPSPERGNLPLETLRGPSRRACPTTELLVLVCALGERAPRKPRGPLAATASTAASSPAGCRPGAATYDEVALVAGDVTIVQIRRRGKGCLSYVVGAAERCVVIDPSTDLERPIAVAAARGWRITHVADTHLHADHVSGARLLAEAAGADPRPQRPDAYCLRGRPAARGRSIPLSPGRSLGVEVVGHAWAHHGLDHACPRRPGPVHRRHPLRRERRPPRPGRPAPRSSPTSSTTRSTSGSSADRTRCWSCRPTTAPGSTSARASWSAPRWASCGPASRRSRSAEDEFVTWASTEVADRPPNYVEIVAPTRASSSSRPRRSPSSSSVRTAARWLHPSTEAQPEPSERGNRVYSIEPRPGSTRMKISTQLAYAGGFKQSAAHVAELEQAGLDLVWVAEAYGFDGPSLMGYLAALTETVEIGSGILPIYSRTPTLAGHDGRRHRRAERRSLPPRPRRLGTAGHRGLPRRPLHGARWVGPGRSSRSAARSGGARSRSRYDGRYYHLPLPEGEGTGLGKALKIIAHPVRPRDPDLDRRAGREERRDVRRDRRRLDAAPLHPRAGRARSGATRWPPARPSATRRSARCRSPPGACWPSARARRSPALRELARPMIALYVGGMGAEGQELLQRRGRAATAGRPRRPRSRTSTSRGRRRRPRRRSPTSSWS